MKFFRRLRRLARLAGVGLTIAAISQEMSKPAADRTWTGKVFGVVPYDFRPPTWERLRDAFWNPDDPRLFTERPLGVGWAINLFRAQLLMRGAFENLMGDGHAEVERPRRSERKASARP
jgi:hypothetical protein